MKKFLFIFLVFVFLLSFARSDFVFAQEQKTEIYFFYSETCSHCKAEKEFLKDLKQRYPEIEIKEYEVINNAENQTILKDFYERYNVPEREQGYVPVTFTSTRYFVGFSDQIGKDLESCIKECLNGSGDATSQKIRVPFFGEVDISKMSLPVLTITLGALDGLNPCAMWILLFLIALLINSRSRKRMWLIGGTFILTSGIIYFLILSAWLNFFFAISYVTLTRILIGIFAVGFGIWQIKNFITFKPGVCKVTDGNASWQDRLKERLKGRAEKLALSPLTFGILTGIIILAFGVNLVEFFCSAGLPAVFTKILSSSNLNPIAYYFYLLLYAFIFMLDDLIVFSLAMITLRRINFTEKYNYWATLIGGILILILGILLVFKPEFLMFSL